MTPKYVIIDKKPVRLIVNTGPTRPLLDPADVARALGGKPAAATEPAAGPLTLFAVRQELYRRMQSPGGAPEVRPAAKAAFSPKHLARLEELAAALSEPGFAPSAGQVADVLLTRALDQLGPDALPGLAAELKAHEPSGAGV